MAYEVTVEQEQLSAMVRDLLEAGGHPRASFDGGPNLDTPVWKQLTELGLVGLVVPEAMGGAGGSVFDQTLVAEQLGAAATVVPIVTSSLAASLLVGLGTPAGRVLVDELLAGESVVLVAVSAARAFDLGLEASESAPGWSLRGAVDDLLEAAPAQRLLVPASTTRGTGWFSLAADATGVELLDQPSLDPTQRLAAITLDDAPAELVGLAPGDGRLEAALLELAWTLLAAQATGAAAHALEISTEYAKQRKASGQPIGRFQAIKHRMAEMLVAVENARSATYDAAWAIDGGRGDAAQAAHLAKAVAGENAVHVVHDAIQSHGGIGFTWEYDLHLFLRRAKSCQLVLGSPDEHLEAIAASLLDHPADGSGGPASRSGGRSSSTAAIIEAAGAEAFHEELRTWLDEHLPEGWGTPAFRMPRDPDDRRTFLRGWQATMASGRWVGIHWPEAFGGRNASLAEQIVYNAELTARSVPPLPGHRGLTIVGPTLVMHGTPEQQERWLERIRRGDDIWAGGFSEPDAGSDLAALRTRGDIDGDVIVVNGQKIWTSGARTCNWIYTLVRTDPAAAKHRGISVVAIPLDSPGVTIRPIRQITGGAGFNEVFFEDVVVPVDNIIGPLNAGWQVNRTTLSHEHFTLFIGTQSRFARSVEDITRLATTVLGPDGQPRSHDPLVRNRIARAWGTARLLLVNGMRNVAKVQAGGNPGPEGSISKLFGQESEKALFELAIDIAGPAGVLDRGARGAPDRGKWQFGYLGSRAATIGGGTSEIHKNKIGESILGLPRDLWADAD